MRAAAARHCPTCSRRPVRRPASGEPSPGTSTTSATTAWPTAPCRPRSGRRSCTTTRCRWPRSPASRARGRSCWSPAPRTRRCARPAVDVWERIVRSYPLSAHWLDGEPVGGIDVIAKLEDRMRRLVVDDGAVATGIVTVGDATASTDPSLGRGASIGLLDACALRNLLRDVDLIIRLEVIERWDERTQRWSVRGRDAANVGAPAGADRRPDRRCAVRTGGPPLVVRPVARRGRPLRS